MKVTAETITIDQVREIREWARNVIADCDVAIRAEEGRSTRYLKPENLIRIRDRIADLWNARNGGGE